MMFWTYFKKLNFIFTEIIGPIQIIIKAGSMSLDDLISDFANVRDQFFPEFCDDEHLPIHAKNRNVPVQRETEPTDDFRVRVNNARAIAARAGRKRTVIEMMKQYGFDNPDIINLRTEDEQRWAQFRVEFDSGGLTELRLANLITEINELKPGRSIIGEIRTNTEIDYDLQYVGRLSVANIISIECED